MLVENPKKSESCRRYETRGVAYLWHANTPSYIFSTDMLLLRSIALLLDI